MCGGETEYKMALRQMRLSGELPADPIRVAAAHKAWQTMRSPAWKRHNAAVKAWKTRRARYGY